MKCPIPLSHILYEKIFNLVLRKGYKCNKLRSDMYWDNFPPYEIYAWNIDNSVNDSQAPLQTKAELLVISEECG